MHHSFRIYAVDLGRIECRMLLASTMESGLHDAAPEKHDLKLDAPPAVGRTKNRNNEHRGRSTKYVIKNNPLYFTLYIDLTDYYERWIQLEIAIK